MSEKWDDFSKRHNFRCPDGCWTCLMGDYDRDYEGESCTCLCELRLSIEMSPDYDFAMTPEYYQSDYYHTSSAHS